METSENQNPNPSATVPTKFSEEDAAILLARDWLWEKLPTMFHLALYRREDGAYFCAVEGCEIAGQPEQGKDQMVTIGPLCFCHEHGKAVLKRLRQDFGAGTRDRPCQWHYLSKTVHNAERRDEIVAEQSKEDGEENKRAAGAHKEMETRAQRLVQARAWAPAHIKWVAAKRAEAEVDKALPQARQSPAADKPSAEVASDSEPIKPAPDPNNPFLGKSREELNAARGQIIQTGSQVDDWQAAGTLTPEEGVEQKARIRRALNHIAQAEIAATKAAEDAARREQKEKHDRLQAFWTSLGYGPKPEDSKPAPGNPSPVKGPLVHGQAGGTRNGTNGGAEGSASKVVAFVKVILSGARVRFADKRGTPGAMEYQCVVAANVPHACDRWDSADRMKIMYSPNKSKEGKTIFFGICSVCVAIARTDGVEIGDPTLEQTLAAHSGRTPRSDSLPDSGSPRPRGLNRPGKTARDNARRRAADAAQKARAVEKDKAAASKPKKPSKEEREAAKAAARGRR